MIYPGQAEFRFDEAASFFLPCAEIFRQNPNMMTEIYIFSQKNSQKIWWDSLNAVSTSPPNFPPDLHNPSRNFHCSKNFVPLIAKPWAGGIQLRRTSNFFHEIRKFIVKITKKTNFSRQQAKSFLLIVQTLWQNLILFFPKIFFAKYSSGQIEFMFRNPAEKKTSEVQIAYTLDPKKLWENCSSIK